MRETASSSPNGGERVRLAERKVRGRSGGTVDAGDLKSSAHCGRKGSNPFSGTNFDLA